jgi:hypothetical protein
LDSLCRFFNTVLSAYFTLQEQEQPQSPVKANLSSIPPPYQKPLKPSLKPPLIPNEDESVKQEDEEGLFSSIGKLIGGAKSLVAEIFGAAFSRKKRVSVRHQLHGRPSSWPVQESYAIPHDETPPPLDTRTPTPRKNYAFMSKEPEKIHHIRPGRPQQYSSGWTRETPQQQQQQPQQVHHQQYLHHHHRQYSAGSQTFYEPSCEATKEIVFGAVQEGDINPRAAETKATNHGEQNRLRYRSNYMRYNGNNQ